MHCLTDPQKCAAVVEIGGEATTDERLPCTVHEYYTPTGGRRHRNRTIPRVLKWATIFASRSLRGGVGAVSGSVRLLVRHSDSEIHRVPDTRCHAAVAIRFSIGNACRDIRCIDQVAQMGI